MSALPQKQTFARVLKASRLRLYSLPEWRAAWSGGTLSQGLVRQRCNANLQCGGWLSLAEGYRLEKKGDDSYRLINARFNVAVFQLDGVSLERIAAFLEKRTSQANSPDAQHR